MDRLAADTSIQRSANRPATLAWVEALAATATIAERPRHLLAHVLADRASETPDAPALLSETESFSFLELSQRIERYAAWAQAASLRKGDCVALVMSNRPEYVAIWLGLSLAGAVTALINTNLQGAALAHALRVSTPRLVIAEAPFLARVAGALAGDDAGETAPPLWSHGANDLGCARLDAVPDARFIAREHVSINDRALLIFTSGTTGLPKAAAVSHRRVLNWALWFKGLLGNSAQDRMYNCLPLYHSVGGVVAVAATLAAGGSTVIAPKFSASRFWSDVRRWNCTQIQYIGELCRYLLHAPEAPDERRHRLRAACGNGLREDVWRHFQDRFAIPQIVEFYASTEGSFSLFNAEGKPGAIGRIPPYLRHRFPTRLIALEASGEPVRGGDGFCVQAAQGEAGEAIGRIAGPGEAGGFFEGYTDPQASTRKVLRDVFEEGDAWFRSGDLMRTDAAGYYYFVDRLGDTFRWKGENVSTLEVANVLAAIPGVQDAAVYGVAVPGHDGKAGMACLQADENFSLADFHALATAALPAYAVPVFLRIGTSLALTDTFKHRTQAMAEDGYQPAFSGDRFFVRPAGATAYVPLCDDMRRAIETGTLRI